MSIALHHQFEIVTFSEYVMTQYAICLLQLVLLCDHASLQLILVSDGIVILTSHLQPEFDHITCMDSYFCEQLDCQLD